MIASDSSLSKPAAFCRQLKMPAQRQNRHDAIAHRSHPPALHRVNVAAADIDDLGHRFDRNGEHVAVDFDHQTRQNGQRQRQLDRQGRAAARLALDVDRAVQTLDFRLNDVHAHAAARHFAHLFGGAQTRQPD